MVKEQWMLNGSKLAEPPGNASAINDRLYADSSASILFTEKAMLRLQ